MQPTPTWSPTAYVVTAEPISVTVPAISWPGTIGKRGAAPLLAGLVDVAVADAGVGDGDAHVVGAQVAPLDRALSEGALGLVDDDGGSGRGHVSTVGSASRDPVHPGPAGGR